MVSEKIYEKHGMKLVRFRPSNASMGDGFMGSTCWHDCPRNFEKCETVERTYTRSDFSKWFIDIENKQYICLGMPKYKEQEFRRKYHKNQSELF